jgi:hypothetical protein
MRTSEIGAEQVNAKKENLLTVQQENRGEIEKRGGSRERERNCKKAPRVMYKMQGKANTGGSKRKNMRRLGRAAAPGHARHPSAVDGFA